jgi:thiamine-phosphate pyrophosphorylase
VIIHLITDRRRLAGATADPGDARRCLSTQIRHAVDAGVDVVQIRERDLDARDLSSVVRAVVALTRGTHTRVVVNDRVDVALACGADGVHLRADSVPAASVRAIAPAGFLVGRSVHSVEAARDAADTVDYLMAGTVWATESKPPNHQLLGIAGLEAIVCAADVPVLAVGGVSVDGVRDLAAAGAAGIAAIGLFLGPSRAGCRATHLGDLVSVLRRSFDSAGSSS